ncbi:response regulator transcription factor [Clostridium tagluense]|uniref:response regulator transcription factor n=1 Tax=Clostridium tagluense TaxID=360422 RepID=UPI001C0AF25F|nr:response regulator transcription factor [Clostridium tagluense]MBU3127559.1 response regulator transcription factor [Clostridium tagluense]MCB2312570.1 response regulator transcription factor [Clostridium tagluense]MCB2317245.1 response regulator transcription factor [Clostridium tagluense]MCB2322110.1 response regulator transcription factor [Clostridium tagluense]MCB2327041.1 response regulator transcription factor [Clostridium tagluense]
MENLINKSKILIVDDEEDILKLLSTVLKKEGFENIYTAIAAKEAIDLVSRLDPDIILLDIMMPGRDGYDVCKEIRKTSRTPILFMSAKTEELDRILGFALGADDYITKPFSPKEVAYRIKAHLRRNNYIDEDKNEKGKTIVFGPFELNEEKIEFKKNGESIQLKAKEFKMLAYMLKNPNQILSKEKICSGVWGEDYIGFDNTIMVHIRRLREKIEDNPSLPKYIVNIKGLGYKFVVKGE